MIELITPPESAGLTQYGLSKGAATGRFLFTAGMALDVATLSRMEAAKSIDDEVGICLGNIQSFLEARGAGLPDIMKVTAYVSERGFIDELKAALVARFAPAPCPVTSILVAGIAGDCRVELDVIATQP